MTGREWFGDVIIGTKFEANKLVGFFTAGGEHDDGDIGFAAEGTADVKAVETREVEVKDNEIWGVVTGTGEGIEPITGGMDAIVALFEVVASDFNNFRFVINDEDKFIHEFMVG